MLIRPVTVAERSKICPVFARSAAGIVGVRISLRHGCCVCVCLPVCACVCVSSFSEIWQMTENMLIKKVLFRL
jgi:hypothetical protein